MNSCILIGHKKYLLTDAQAEAIVSAIRSARSHSPDEVCLAGVPEGQIVKIGGQEFIVLEHAGDLTYLIAKDLIEETSKFSEKNNNYNGSTVDEICQAAAEVLEDLVGSENVIEFEVDLTSDDGLKDYGAVCRKCALITADMYRRYVDILDHHNPKKYWWLATPHSTSRHENDRWAKCVSPSGYVGDVGYCSGVSGVRPFCILKSHIFVSR